MIGLEGRCAFGRPLYRCRSRATSSTTCPRPGRLNLSGPGLMTTRPCSDRLGASAATCGDDQPLLGSADGIGGIAGFVVPQLGRTRSGVKVSAEGLPGFALSAHPQSSTSRLAQLRLRSAHSRPSISESQRDSPWRVCVGGFRGSGELGKCNSFWR
jgi:hypothetical protein